MSEALCADPEGGGGAGGPDPPLKNHKKIGVYSNTGPDPLKLTKLTFQHLMIGHHRPSQRNVSLAGRCWPAYSGILILHLLIKQK